MIIVDAVLDAAALADTAEVLAQVPWEDGRKTAGAVARAVKHNQQADLSGRTGTRLKARLVQTIRRHPVVEAWARPLKISPLLISRTGPGNEYGLHIDNPVMGNGETRLRTDISFTLFLSAPDSYEGGALEIETVSGTESIKLPAGSMVLYPSTELHRVSPVVSGERIVCVGWIQSAIRAPDARAILFDLANLKASLARTLPPGAPELLTLSKTEANLIRMWTD